MGQITHKIKGGYMVGNQLKDLRLKKGLSLAAVYKKTGYAKSSIMEVEKGNDPHLSTIVKLAKTYGREIIITFK